MQPHREGYHGLRADRVFDGERVLTGRPIIVLRDGRVEAIEDGPIDPAIPVTDHGAATLLPGLVDAHAHLAFDPCGDPAQQFLHDCDDTVLTRIRHHARVALLSGVTTVRDLGDRGYLTLRVRDERRTDLPALLCAGPPVTRERGHCWFLGGEAEPGAALAAAVDERVARGVDVIKVMATGGVITPGWAPHESQYTVADLRTIVDRARLHGVPVTAHAHGADGVSAAIAAGVDGIEHASFLGVGGVQASDEVIAALAATRVFVGVASARLPSGKPLSPLFQAVADVFARQHRAGVRLVCSSDAGVDPQKPFDCLPHGIVDFRDVVGMDNQTALTAATSLAADSCGMGHRKGRLLPGHDADILVVAGDATADVSALRHPLAIHRAGMLVS
ncbi:amidohydrolase family protein [Couchioplanes caeruleus]|uniref:Amidohydrolase n=2 Tax=Couchioplanes caeruleus TaxID=56438 RepID=A0A1K0GTL5_9ACTN|nr:amidohydrolase family protein [Couchioplanes caeruleus]OJF15806.1 Amidohydrolase [Couchioplanes caeruleus subsp. caeruleus]ROP33026.1 imidazolonepropionase-like amidohydrolase [Couchioplanes caeruleus]